MDQTRDQVMATAIVTQGIPFTLEYPQRTGFSRMSDPKTASNDIGSDVELTIQGKPAPDPYSIEVRTDVELDYQENHGDMTDNRISGHDF